MNARPGDGGDSACVSDSTLVTFFDGALSVDRLTSLEKHLDVCSNCAALVDAAAPVLAGEPATSAPQGLPPEAAPGERLAGRYRLEALLGWGATGFLLRARDEALDTVVAVKLLRAEYVQTPASLQRLKRELQVARALNHRHVCRVFELVLDVERPFLVMELAERSLLDELGAASVSQSSLAERLVDAEGLAGGLAAMHRAGIIHRDIKPANVLRMADGRLVLSDFGLASLSVARSRMTLFVGTPLYMAPELLTEPASPRSDVYALGLVLHELLFRSQPTWRRRGGQRSLEAPPGLANRRQRALLDLCRQCVSALPEHRPGDGAQVLDRLVAIRQGKRPISPRSRRWLLVAGGLCALGLPAVPAVQRYRARRRPGEGFSADGVPQVVPAPQLWLANASRASFPGGGLRVVNRSPQEGFWVMHTEGERWLVSEDGKDAVLSPDGVHVAFVRSPIKDMFLEEEVWVLNLKTKVRRYLAHGGCPRWSSQGTDIFFHDHQRRVLCSVPLTAPTPLPTVIFARPRSAFPVFASDDRRIMFGGEGAASVVDRYTGDQLFRWAVPRFKFSVAWREDERVLALAGFAADTFGVWVVDMFHRRTARVAAGPFTSPVWFNYQLTMDRRDTGARSIWRTSGEAIESALQRGFTERQFVDYLQRNHRVPIKMMNQPPRSLSRQPTEPAPRTSFDTTLPRSR